MKKEIELDFKNTSKDLRLVQQIGTVSIPKYGEADIVSTVGGLFWEMRLNGVHVGVDISPVLQEIGASLETALKNEVA